MREITPSTHSQGFSLIEVLVAMTILAVAGVALIETGQHHADRLEHLEVSLIADTIAANRLVELRLSPAGAEVPQSVDMAGWTWRVETRLGKTSDPELDQVTIEVFRQTDHAPSGQLTGFIDTRQTP